MLHITAELRPNARADKAPPVLVTGVYDSREGAEAARGQAADLGYPGLVVLPVTWSRSSRRPIIGETLSTCVEASGLVAVVLPL